MLLPSALFDLKTHKMRLRTPEPRTPLVELTAYPQRPLAGLERAVCGRKGSGEVNRGGKEEKERGGKKKRAFPYFFFTIGPLRVSKVTKFTVT